MSMQDIQISKDGYSSADGDDAWLPMTEEEIKCVEWGRSTVFLSEQDKRF